MPGMSGLRIVADTNFLINVHEGKPETGPFPDAIDLNPEIKEIAIALRQQHSIKTPDAIIVATSKFMQLPLITSDKRLRKLKGIKIILI